MASFPKNVKEYQEHFTGQNLIQMKLETGNWQLFFPSVLTMTFTPQRKLVDKMVVNTDVSTYGQLEAEGFITVSRQTYDETEARRDTDLLKVTGSTAAELGLRTPVYTVLILYSTGFVTPMCTSVSLKSPPELGTHSFSKAR